MGQGAPHEPSTDLPRLHKELLSWYDAHHRRLPWRGLGDPYAIWVSEIMLQQTRVETVVPYFLRWMAEFPDVHALAAADEEAVLRLWSGLGYYSRARNLHAAAQQVVHESQGRIPRDRKGLQQLAGVGAYTSGAIASIAYGEQVPAVDGNVLRVLARLYGDPRDIRDSATRQAMEGRAAILVPARRPGDWNQALMELGATICTPTTPHCDACPVVSSCVAHTSGRTDRLPVRRAKTPPRAESMHFAWVEGDDDHVLLVRNPSKGLLGGLWGLPGGPAETPLEGLVARQTGHQVRALGRIGAASHRFTHRLWQMDVHLAVLHESPAAVDADRARWVPLGSIRDEAVSTAHRKAIAAALGGCPPVPPLSS